MKCAQIQGGEVISFSEPDKTGVIRSDSGTLFSLRFADFDGGRLFRLYPTRGDRVVFEVDESDPAAGCRRALQVRRLVDIEASDIESDVPPVTAPEPSPASKPRKLQLTAEQRAKIGRRLSEARWRRRTAAEQSAPTTEGVPDAHKLAGQP
jgi:hypothetical protein